MHYLSLLLLTMVVGGDNVNLQPPPAIPVPYTREQNSKAIAEHWKGLSQDDKYYTRYLTLNFFPENEGWIPNTNFVVSSTSRGEYLRKQFPIRLPESDVYALNLYYLKWSVKAWNHVTESYPYSKKIYPEVISGEWLADQIGDTVTSDAYYVLFYGVDNVPADVPQFLKFFGIKETQKQPYGWIETKSGVSVVKQRFLQFYDAELFKAWGTKDNFDLLAKHNFLEFPDGNIEHAGEEWIVLVPKVDSTLKTRSCTQAYFLSKGNDLIVNKQNGKAILLNGKKQFNKRERIEEGAARLVVDHTLFKNYVSITNNGSCIQCHSKGMNLPTENGIESLGKLGTQRHTDKAGDEQIATFHLLANGLTKELGRQQQDYQEYVCSCWDKIPVSQEVRETTSVKNASNYQRCLLEYNQDIGLVQADRESYAQPGEVALAIGYAAKSGILVGEAASQLADGKQIRREQWAEIYLPVQEYIKINRVKKP